MRRHRVHRIRGFIVFVLSGIFVLWGAVSVRPVVGQEAPAGPLVAQITSDGLSIEEALNNAIESGLTVSEAIGVLLLEGVAPDELLSIAFSLFPDAVRFIVTTAVALSVPSPVIAEALGRAGAGLTPNVIPLPGPAVPPGPAPEGAPPPPPGPGGAEVVLEVEGSQPAGTQS